MKDIRIENLKALDLNGAEYIAKVRERDVCVCERERGEICVCENLKALDLNGAEYIAKAESVCVCVCVFVCKYL